VPGADATSAVVPLPSGSNAIPPAATVPGEPDCPTGIVTAADCALVVVVTSRPTAADPLVTVTVTAVPPGRTGSSSKEPNPPAGGTPRRTRKGRSGLSVVVVLEEKPVSSTAGATTATVAVRLV
jgi:hypothetical protein